MWIERKGDSYVYLPDIRAACRHSFFDSSFYDTVHNLQTCKSVHSMQEVKRQHVIDDWGAWKRKKYDWPSERSMHPWM